MNPRNTKRVDMMRNDDDEEEEEDVAEALSYVFALPTRPRC